MYGQLSRLQYDSVGGLKIGRDKYYLLKQRLAPAYPEYRAEVLLYSNVRGVDRLTAWLPMWPELYRVR